jgi:uncharacterized membrane protein
VHRPALCSPSTAAAAAVSTLAFIHSIATRRARRSLLFAALGGGVGAVAEYLAVNVTEVVRHHSRPQVLGVPIAALLSWFAITYAAYASIERVLGPIQPGTGRRHQLAHSLATAAVATSLDLLLDPYGLEQGLWEWNIPGSYALDVVGPNTRRGVPWANFAAWLALTAAISRLYALIDSAEPTRKRRSPGDWGPFLLLAYYAPAALWAIRNRRPRLLLYAAPIPLTLALGTRRPGRQAQAFQAAEP